MRSQRQTLSMDCTHAQTRWNLSPSSSFYLHHWWHHHHHKHPRSYDNLHWFPVFSREPCSSSPSWSARACQSKRFLNQGKAEVFAYLSVCVFLYLCSCLFVYVRICVFVNLPNLHYNNHDNDQDSLDLELGASASRVAPQPPPQRRRSSGPDSCDWVFVIVSLYFVFVL